jgi:hypothetical protein
MRGKGAILAAVGLALLTSGCNTLDREYVRQGIGTDLGSVELPETSNLQDIYVGEICRQAGLRVTRQGDFLVCEEVGLRPAEWATFVQAGLNDIDRRCDGYLAWLDNKRRWREPILKQLHTTAAATAAIMGLTGVGATPIAIVATAFGFAQDSFVNFSSRLITEIDHSVIQAVVLDNQNVYRAKLATIQIDNRPAALYLLRNYLRICMPFSIEMSINNTMTTYHRGGAEALARSEPLLVRPTTVARIVTDASRPLPRQERLRIATGNRSGATEPALPNRFITAVQLALCVQPDGELGPEGSTTRRAIGEYLTGRRRPLAETINATNRPLLSEAVDEVANCVGEGFGNPFEVGAYGVPAAQRAAKIRAFQTDLRNALKDRGSTITVPDSGVFDTATRDAIAEYRRASNTVLGGARNRQVDNKLKSDVRP